MTAARRDRLAAICDELSTLAEEVSVLAEAIPDVGSLLALAEAHQLSAIALRLRVIRLQVPDDTEAYLDLRRRR